MAPISQSSPNSSSSERGFSMNRRSISLSSLILLLISGIAGAEMGAKHEVRLVLQITVDQLRGDLPGRVLDRLEPGGFRYLFEEGIYYANAHYRCMSEMSAKGRHGWKVKLGARS